ncbi:MAG TPA: membrane protein insertion efficiency factor YidD [Planctomycetota bacterium]|nr:membrane protein insertion efficiency factor YidD [Planctomycetota bacterium]
MEPPPPPSPPRRRNWGRIVLRSIAALAIYLALESLIPPLYQPSTRACLGMIGLYQRFGSPAVGALGVRCRYEPSCSHYAADAIAHFGTLPGIAKALGRLWRCSPWGGGGYDPAF